MKWRALPCVVSAMAMVFGSLPAFAAANNGRDLQAYVNARLAEIDDRSDEALQGYAQLFKSNPDSPALTDRLYENAIREGDMEAALRAVRAMELRDQADGAAPMLLYADAFRRKDWDKAGDAATILAERSNYGFIAPLLKSWIRVGKGQPHQFKLDNPSEQGLLNFYSTDQRVYLELARSNLSEAKKMAAVFRGVDSEFASDLLLRAAPIFAANGDGEFAANLIRNVAASNYLPILVNARQSKATRSFTPQQGVAAVNTRLSSSLLEQNVPDQALILARLAVWLDPESDSARRSLARALLENKLGEAAMDVFAAISPSSPYWPKSVNEQFRYLSDSGRNEEALKLVRAALESQPNSASLLLLFAQGQEKTGNLESAGDAYSRLSEEAARIGIGPKQRALYLLFQATALDNDGKWEEARQLLEQAQQLDPDNPYILNYLGFSLLDRNEELRSALAFVKRAHKLAPDSAAISDSLGLAHYLNGEFDEAIKYLEIAVKMSGNDLVINEHLGDAYWMAGRRVEARYAWKSANLLADGEESERLVSKIDIGLGGSSRDSQTD